NREEVLPLGQGVKHREEGKIQRGKVRGGHPLPGERSERSREGGGGLGCAESLLMGQRRDIGREAIRGRSNLVGMETQGMDSLLGRKRGYSTLDVEFR
ncbi:MAG: hypothetical protein JWN14_1020, partial [Chthonomonadales bacterium]|nr:hypothetical protein [Chthonomonadales bacterium]